MSWAAYALVAAILWGMNYAMSERLMTRVSISTLILVYSISNMAFAAFYNAHTQKLLDDIKVIRSRDVLFISIFVVTGILANFLTYFATKEKNAAMAGMIEICYPVFAAIIAYICFGEKQFTTSSIIGAGLIFSGIALIVR